MTDGGVRGRQIGGYTLVERLGAGGMSSVYRAHDPVHQREVAIKVLPVHLAANETLHQRFFHEAQMTARLNHPHILPIYDFGEEGGTPYIVMQLVDGGTLEKVIAARRLPLPAVARILYQVAQALDYAHSQGVIHRDIKPHNILFDRTGHAFLADFGIARLQDASAHLTGTGGFIGTAAYASPEQCRGEELTPLSDIYSLGVVLYEMLTGALPFDGSTPLAIMHKHMSEPAPNPLRHRADLPLGLVDVMRKALAKLPPVRYQSAHALSAALNEVLRRELGARPLGDDAPPPGPNPVFDKPPAAYTAPPPMPDALLQDLTSHKRQTASVQPLHAQPVTERPARIHSSSLLPWLLVTAALLGAAAIIAWLALR